MGRKIVVTSGKGGVGKTTLTASLGIAIAETGKKVVLVDADIGLNNLDVVLAVETRWFTTSLTSYRGNAD